jgi:hypothetical protein
MKKKPNSGQTMVWKARPNHPVKSQTKNITTLGAISAMIVNRHPTVFSFAPIRSVARAKTPGRLADPVHEQKARLTDDSQWYGRNHAFSVRPTARRRAHFLLDFRESAGIMRISVRP